MVNLFYHAVHFHTAKTKKWKATSQIRDAAGRFEGRQREIEVLRKRRRGFPPRGELLKKKGMTARSEVCNSRGLHCGKKT